MPVTSVRLGAFVIENLPPRPSFISNPILIRADQCGNGNGVLELEDFAGNNPVDQMDQAAYVLAVASTPSEVSIDDRMAYYRLLSNLIRGTNAVADAAEQVQALPEQRFTSSLEYGPIVLLQPPYYYQETPQAYFGAYQALVNTYDRVEDNLGSLQTSIRNSNLYRINGWNYRLHWWQNFLMPNIENLSTQLESLNTYFEENGRTFRCQGDECPDEFSQVVVWRNLVISPNISPAR